MSRPKDAAEDPVDFEAADDESDTDLTTSSIEELLAADSFSQSSAFDGDDMEDEMEEPESAAKSMQAKTPAIARPPLKWPTQAMEKRMMRRATPPVDMKVEARMKKGMASRV